jgi:hypothetical protein
MSPELFNDSAVLVWKLASYSLQQVDKRIRVVSAEISVLNAS